jgi:threonylcarbamoyladenosine tRNA methylthiotransferase MtaB
MIVQPKVQHRPIQFDADGKEKFPAYNRRVRRFSIETLGCKVNSYESEQIATLLRARGLQQSDAASADIRIVNTCSVTTAAAKQSRQTIRRSIRLPLLEKTGEPATEHPEPTNPHAKIIVTGCYATSDPKVVRDLPGVDAVITHHDNVAAKLEELLDSWDDASTSRGAGVSPAILESRARRPRHETTTLPLLGDHQSDRQRAHLKIQDGCDAHCTYCIIPQLRPTLESKSIDDAVEEARRLIDSGHVELVLTGIFLGAYGQPTALRRRQPRDTAKPLAELIESLCTRVPGLRRLRLSSLEPGDLTPELLSILRSHEQVVPHFHLPLQSGSDAILRKMNRQYTRDDYLRMLDHVNRAYDRPAITTDIIVAFPGETDDDFADTLDIVTRARFIHIHAFPFSARPKTAAARWIDQFIAPQIASERIANLNSLATQHSYEYRQQFLNHDMELLVEQGSHDTLRHGRTPRYFDVHFESSSVQTGDAVTVHITHVTPTRTHGELHHSSFIPHPSSFDL